MTSNHHYHPSINQSIIIVLHSHYLLSTSRYMRPSSAVVEFAPYANDARCLPGGGPFSRLAAVMSHNYMMHHPALEEYVLCSIVFLPSFLVCDLSVCVSLIHLLLPVCLHFPTLHGTSLTIHHPLPSIHQSINQSINQSIITLQVLVDRWPDQRV